MMLEEKIKELLGRERHVEIAYLFGSAAQGEMGELEKKRYYKGREPPREDVIEHWNNILKHKQKVEKVLDVGCGTGFFWET